MRSRSSCSNCSSNFRVGFSGSRVRIGAPISGGMGGWISFRTFSGMSGSTFQIGGTTGTFFLRVATVMCGQLKPLKLSMTVWEYWSCKKLGVPLTVSIQNVAKTSAETAFGP